MSTPDDSQPRNDERFYFRVLIVMSLALGTGFCLLLFALNDRDQETAAGKFEAPIHPAGSSPAIG